MDLEALKNILPSPALVRDPDRLAGLAVDGKVPRAAALPATLEEASQVLALAHEQGWGVLIRGRGTKAGLGNPPLRADLVLGLEKLNKIIDIDPANLTVTVQAGAVLADLQDLVAGTENRCFFPLDGELKDKADQLCSDREHKGAFVPLDPLFFSRATMGGILAVGAAGPSRLRYGLPRDLVLGTRFILADGTVIGMGGKTVKNVSGYDVSKLLIGSLGSLGVIAEATLRLLPLPQKSGGVVLVFGGLDQALACCAEILDSKLEPTSLEIMNRIWNPPKNPVWKWFLVLRIDGSEAEFMRHHKDLSDLAEKHGAAKFISQDRTEAGTLWARLSEPDSPTIFKGFFPFSAYAQVARAWSDLADKAGLDCLLNIQPGCGTIQASPVLGAPKQQASLGQELRRAAQELGGGMVVEAAGVEVKQDLDVWGPLPSGFKIMEGLKKELDPRAILNPGRFLGGL